MDSEGNVFKFFKRNLNGEISYEIISKTNDLSVTSSLEHRFLYASNFLPNPIDSEINFKIEYDKCSNNCKIKTSQSNRYLGSSNESNASDFSNLILNCLDEENQIFRLEKLEPSDLFINENDSKQILKRLNYNSCKIQTYIQNKNFYFQSIGLKIVKIGQEWPAYFEFEIFNDKVKLRHLNQKKYLKINDQNQLVLSNNTPIIHEYFDIFFIKFNPNLVCIKSQSTNTFLRADILSNSLTFEKNDANIDDQHLFRISIQNNFVNLIFKPVLFFKKS